jgi:hypothetical protein
LQGKNDTCNDHFSNVAPFRIRRDEARLCAERLGCLRIPFHNKGN